MPLRLTAVLFVAVLLGVACSGETNVSEAEPAKDASSGEAPTAAPAEDATQTPTPEDVALEQMKEFQKALEFHFMYSGEYAETLKVLTEPTMDGERHIDSIPDDPWGEAYVYRPKDGEWVLFSKGPDRTAGTDDDVRLK